MTPPFGSRLQINSRAISTTASGGRCTILANVAMIGEVLERRRKSEISLASDNQDSGHSPLHPMNTPRKPLGFAFFGWRIGELVFVFYECIPNWRWNHHRDVFRSHILAGRSDNGDDAPCEKCCGVAAVCCCGKGCLIIGK